MDIILDLWLPTCQSCYIALNKLVDLVGYNMLTCIHVISKILYTPIGVSIALGSISTTTETIQVTRFLSCLEA